MLTVAHRISPAYERTPYYIGTKLWNELDVDTQKIENIFAERHLRYLALLSISNQHNIISYIK